MNQLCSGAVGGQNTEELDMVPTFQDYVLDRMYT